MTALAHVAVAALRNYRAGHRPAHALRLALLNNEANNLNRRMK
ncbi:MULTISPECIES: hypothetical protein [unclassified Duganella]|nr:MULTISPECIES: hypothetical protein [unclassified Duganella]